MSTSQQTSEETAARGSSDTVGLTEQIKKLVDKLDAPKRKSLWDVFPVLTTFMGTVVLAGISLYVTQSSQRQEAQRTHDYQAAESARVAQFNQAQIETQRAQIRVEELKALTTLAPLLASHDPAARATARQLLQAVSATNATNPAVPNLTGGTSVSGSPAAGSPGAARSGAAERGTLTAGTSDHVVRAPSVSSSSLFDQFAAIALSSDASTQERVAATQKIGEIATRTNSRAVRERAVNVAAQIAGSAEAPAEVKKAADDVIAQIKRVTPDEVVQLIRSQPLTRQITQIILHDAGLQASSYKGATTIYSIARIQAERFGGSRLGWHYAIAADGAIWLGTPLNDMAYNTPNHNKTSAAVMLLMDGNKEVPTDAQRESLVLVLKALISRLKLDATANSPDGDGFNFHRDLDRRRSCPGSLLTKEMVVGWL